MFYVALLRGINVGGKNKISMKVLKETFERAGMHSVVTYINSGNVIFASDREEKAEIAAVLEEAIEADFGFPVGVLVIHSDEFEAVVRAIPPEWTNDGQMKSDVLFLWDAVDPETVPGQLPLKSEIDTVHYAPGAVLWSVDRKNVTRSGLQKIIGTPLYKQVTVRNVNTVRKLGELLRQAGG